MTNLLEYLENTVQHHPHKTAFVGEAGALTFGELHAQAQAVGSYVAAHMQVATRPVAVFMEKSPAMVAAFQGVLYAGCFYVPLDAEMPAVRIQQILETVQPLLILCDETTRPLLDGWGIDLSAVLFSQAAAHPVDAAELSRLRSLALDVDPAYVVFTSGSTGRPKGVVANHRAVIDYVSQLSRILDLGPHTVFGNQSPLYLDACLKELYPTLRFGATTYLIPRGLFMFPVRLVEYLNTHGINTICWVASALSLVAGLGALDKTPPQHLHTVAFGSEVFPVKHYNKWRTLLPAARFVHLYGPTEATGMSCYYEATREFAEDESIPIGRPFPNTGIVLLDLEDETRPAASGSHGEICIRGTGLSAGYYNDPEKTAAAFVPNPLTPFPDTLYKTGDIGQYNDAGELLFVARRDHQIKHMGHRIELAEIEWAAARHPGVALVCAVFDADKSRIVLYYTAQDVEKAALSSYLKANLPRYMLPHAVLPLEAMPLTPGGKIDRVGLLARYRDGI